MATTDKVVTPKWLGYQILDPEHTQDLEQRAAVHEIERKLPRTEAERQAHADYQKEHHAKAAAHHLMGMKAAQGSGHMDAARKHGAMYGLHIKALGEDAYGPVPEAVKMHVDGPDRKQVYNFKAHKGDAFLFQKEGEKDVQKSELEKGDVIPFPGNPAPAVDTGKYADVHPVNFKAPPSNVRDTAVVGGWRMHVVEPGNNPQCMHQNRKDYSNLWTTECKDCGGVFSHVPLDKGEIAAEPRYKMGHCEQCKRETIHDWGWCKACKKPMNAQPKPPPELRRSEGEPITHDRLFTLYRAIKAFLSIKLTP